MEGLSPVMFIFKCDKARQLSKTIDKELIEKYCAKEDFVTELQGVDLDREFSLYFLLCNDAQPLTITTGIQKPEYSVESKWEVCLWTDYQKPFGINQCSINQPYTSSASRSSSINSSIVLAMFLFHVLGKISIVKSIAGKISSLFSKETHCHSKDKHNSTYNTSFNESKDELPELSKKTMCSIM